MNFNETVQKPISLTLVTMPCYGNGDEKGET